MTRAEGALAPSANQKAKRRPTGNLAASRYPVGSVDGRREERIGRLTQSRRSQRGQSLAELSISLVVLLLLAGGLFDISRAYFHSITLHDAAREGARHGAWFDQANHANPYLYDSEIKSAVDQTLQAAGLPASTLSSTTCPTTQDGNSLYNPPYLSSYYPGTVNQPLLFICYKNTPGISLPAAPTDPTLYESEDLNVILVESFGMVTGFVQNAVGNNVHIAANFHIVIQGFQ
jgi:TadE-like protein